MVRGFLVHPQGLPASLGQCRRQPGALKNHSQDGFSPPLPPAAPFEPLRVIFCKKQTTKRWFVLFGTPSGARTLDTLIKSQVLYQLS